MFRRGPECLSFDPRLGRDRTPGEHMVHQCERDAVQHQRSGSRGPAALCPETRLTSSVATRRTPATRRAPMKDERVEAEAPFFDAVHAGLDPGEAGGDTAHHRAEQTTPSASSVSQSTVSTGQDRHRRAAGQPCGHDYAYPDVDALIDGESRGGAKTALPAPERS